MPNLSDIQKDAYLTTLPGVSPGDVNDTTGLYTYWLDNKDVLGTPVTGEITLDNGHVAQRFATGKITVYDGQSITIQ
jgi:hypothetical protein